MRSPLRAISSRRPAFFPPCEWPPLASTTAPTRCDLWLTVCSQQQVLARKMPCWPEINFYGRASVPPGNDHDPDNFKQADDTLDMCRLFVARHMRIDTIETLVFGLCRERITGQPSPIAIWLPLRESVDIPGLSILRTQGLGNGGLPDRPLPRARDRYRSAAPGSSAPPHREASRPGEQA
jgi:hypothetical protein